MAIPLLPFSSPLCTAAPLQLPLLLTDSRTDLTWFLCLSLMLEKTVSRRVCLRIKHPSGAYDLIFITVRQLQVC
jgi:hypothetical protein